MAASTCHLPLMQKCMITEKDRAIIVFVIINQDYGCFIYWDSIISLHSLLPRQSVKHLSVSPSSRRWKNLVTLIIINMKMNNLNHFEEAARANTAHNLLLTGLTFSQGTDDDSVW